MELPGEKVDLLPGIDEFQPDPVEFQCLPGRQLLLITVPQAEGRGLLREGNRTSATGPHPGVWRSVGGSSG